MGTEERAAKRILVVDDEPGMRQLLVEVLGESGYDVVTAADGVEGAALAACGPDLVLLDLSLPKMNGLEVLRRIKAVQPSPPVIVVTAYASMKTAVSALRLGAYDYLTKPFNITDLDALVKRALEGTRIIDENRYLQGELRRLYRFDNIIGASPAVHQAYVTAAKVADSPASVLILGETGTGKEFLAKTVHYQSVRADGPFVKVNCAALPEALLESELFGHEKGAFTNAVARHIGRFERAHHGTLFLDEVGDIPLPLQVKLLRVLQEKEFERVGGTETLQVDVRIIAATHRDLREGISRGTFREDLYYRLNVIPIVLPPLRERPDDIDLLARHFLARSGDENGKPDLAFTDEARAVLRAYPWPGNIREIQNAVERAAILCEGEEIRPEHLGLETPTAAAPAAEPSAARIPLDLSLRDLERLHICNVYEAQGHNQARAAAILGIDRKTLRSKLREYGLAADAA